MSSSMLYHPLFRHIPEEIIHEILSFHLSIPDTLFCSTSPKSPFAKCSFTDVSSSVVLEVCKQWLRVGTPLLYHTVVLRSRAQVQCLYWTLAHGGAPELRRYIKKVRVEGGYGTVVGDVLKCMTGATDIWINLRLYSKETGKGFARGLPFMNPTRLVLRDVRTKTMATRTRRETFDAIVDSLPRWKNLRSFDYLCSSSMKDFHVSRLLTTLPLCASLQYIHFMVMPSADYDFLKKFLNHPSLIQIKVQEAYHHTELNLGEELADPRYRELLKKINFNQRYVVPTPPSTDLTLVQSAAEAPPPPPLIIPIEPLLRAHPEIRISILSKILRYSAGLPDLCADVPSDNRFLHDWRYLHPPSHSLARLSLVSRDFRAAALPSLYENILLSTVAQCISLSNVLYLTDYGRHVRVIRSVACCRSQPAFHRILEFTTPVALIPARPPSTWEDCHLSKDPGPPFPADALFGLPWSQFSTYAFSIGPSLKYLGFPVTADPDNTPIDCGSFMITLWTFRSLRTLVWCNTAVFKPETMNVFVPSDALPCLEHLVYSSSDETFMQILSLMELPALDTLKLPYAGSKAGYSVFLRSHGHKITRLHMHIASHVPGLFTELCPNVNVFVMWTTIQPCDPTTFSEVEYNISLKQISILYNATNTAVWTKRMMTFLPDMDLSGFKVLQELRIENLEWPTEQYEIERNPFVKIAEHCWEKWRVKVAGDKNIAWRPRLKAQKKVSHCLHVPVVL